MKFTMCTMVVVATAASVAFGVAKEQDQAEREPIKAQVPTSISAQLSRDIEQLKIRIIKLETQILRLIQEREQSTPELTKIIVKLLDDKKRPITIPDFRVQITGAAIQPSKTIDIRKAADASGEVVFESVRTGRYDLRVEAPWKDVVYQYPDLGAMPGTPTIITIVCPTTRPVAERVHIDVEWPEDLREIPLALHMDIDRVDIGVPMRWQTPFDAPDIGGKTLVGKGRVFREGDQRGFGDKWKFDRLQNITEEGVQMRAGEYNVNYRILVARSNLDKDDRHWYDALTWWRYRNGTDKVYQVDSGKPNHWRIKIPKGLLDDVRRQVKGGEKVQ